MNIVGKIAVAYLIALIFFGWGVATMQYRIFPHATIMAVRDFVRGDPSENTTVFQKLQNDFGGKPARFIRDYTPADPSKFKELVIEGTNARREPARLFISDSAPEKYRILVGAFDFETAFWGAILLSPTGEILHRWAMNGDRLEMSETDDIAKNLYGISFFPDGSAAFTLQEPSGGLIKVDYCSQVAWTKPGLFHHVAQITEDKTAFWTYGRGGGVLHPLLMLIDAQTGETLREIDMVDVEKANPEIHIFDMRRVGTEDTNHATHPNHIEALPSYRFEADLAWLKRVTTQAFSQRRKMLRASLKSISSNIEDALIAAQIKPTARPEEVDLKAFCDLSLVLKETEARA